MRASQGSQQKEAGEVGVVEVAATVVDPGAVVVHLHHTPEGRKEESRGIEWSFERTQSDILHLSLKKKTKLVTQFLIKILMAYQSTMCWSQSLLSSINMNQMSFCHSLIPHRSHNHLTQERKNNSPAGYTCTCLLHFRQW